MPTEASALGHRELGEVVMVNDRRDIRVRNSGLRHRRAGWRLLGLISVGAMIGAIAACSAPTQREFGKPDVESITTLVRELTAAYNAKDAAGVTSHFAGSAVLMPPNASTLRGAESIEGYFVNRFAQGATDLVIEPGDIAGSGGLAYVAGDYRLNVVPPDGGPEQRDRGKFLWILRDFNGRWLLEYLSFSSDFAPAQPAG